jgi:hypothetical protein
MWSLATIVLEENKWQMFLVPVQSSFVKMIVYKVDNTQTYRLGRSLNPGSATSNHSEYLFSTYHGLGFVLCAAP